MSAYLNSRMMIISVVMFCLGLWINALLTPGVCGEQVQMNAFVLTGGLAVLVFGSLWTSRKIQKNIRERPWREEKRQRRHERQNRHSNHRYA